MSLDQAAKYFDNAATTPLDPRVREEMLFWMSEGFGNASSIHQWGQRARHAVEQARESIAELVDAIDPSEVVFNSGATEGNNWVVNSFERVITSPFEHSSVREPAAYNHWPKAQTEGWNLTAPTEKYDLLSAMLVNNETGALVNASSWFHLGPNADTGAKFIHRDLTQAAGKIQLHEHAYDLGTFSGHKLHGPKGIGVVHMRTMLLDHPALRGGGQEGGHRGGTLNVPGIVGMGLAAKIAIDEMEAEWQHATELRSILRESIDRIPGSYVVEGEGPGLVQSPYILCACFEGIHGESLVIELDNHGYAISSGSACASQSTEPSQVLKPLGLPNELIRGATRLSFSRFNTLDAAHDLARLLPKVVEQIRSLG